MVNPNFRMVATSQIWDALCVWRYPNKMSSMEAKFTSRSSGTVRASILSWICLSMTGAVLIGENGLGWIGKPSFRFNFLQCHYPSEGMACPLNMSPCTCSTHSHVCARKRDCFSQFRCVVLVTGTMEMWFGFNVAIISYNIIYHCR